MMIISLKRTRGRSRLLVVYKDAEVHPLPVHMPTHAVRSSVRMYTNCYETRFSRIMIVDGVWCDEYVSNLVRTDIPSTTHNVLSEPPPTFMPMSGTTPYLPPLVQRHVPDNTAFCAVSSLFPESSHQSWYFPQNAEFFV